MNFYLEIEPKEDNESIIKNNINLSLIHYSKNIIFKKYYEIVSLEKEKIDKLENCENWDKIKKIGNPYELIYTSYNKKRKNDSYNN